MNSRNFPPVVEPRGVARHGKDSTRMQVITKGAAQSNRILSDFKRGAPTSAARPVHKAKGGPVGCGCGGPIRK